jgi:hypothetical protein
LVDFKGDKMKKSLFLLVIASVLASALFFGCDFLPPPEVQETKTAQNADSTDSADPADSSDAERKDVLALTHLQITYIDENTLASYVTEFININDAPGTERSVTSAPAVVITKTTKFMHKVETGFAETTADNRSARSVTGPGEIPFYVFTLGNQQTGETGFALACGDSRIGAVLAVAEKGDYDDSDNPFTAVFHSSLYAYIENTISVYNSVTRADIENALNTESARSAVINLPVTDVGEHPKRFKLDPNNSSPVLLKTEWHQFSPYNDYYNEVINKPGYGYEHVTGCMPTAIAQIMAYHEKPKKPYYDWEAMKRGEDDEMVGYLMYVIGVYTISDYKPGPIGEDDPKEKGSAQTSTPRNNARLPFIYMDYKDPGLFKNYNLSDIKSSINRKRPVLADGYTEATIIGKLQIPTLTKGAHAWVIDGYRRMTSTVKNKATGIEEKGLPLDYVHCNLGWGGDGNGWYLSGVFNTKEIPMDDDDDPYPRSAGERNYSLAKGIITDITPK